MERRALLQISADCRFGGPTVGCGAGRRYVADWTFLRLCSKDLWEIYEAENPLAEALRKIAALEREDAADELPWLREDREAFGR